MLLQTALAAETHLAEGLTLKLRCTVKVELSLTDLVGMRRLTISKTDEQLILHIKTLIRKWHQDASSLNGALRNLI
jgi:hypothetical protein